MLLSQTNPSCIHIKLFAHKWGHLLFSDHYMECMLQGVRRGITIHHHKRSTETNVMSCTVCCGRILSALRKKDGESEAKTQNWQGFLCCWGCWSGYDAKTAKNSFRGIQSRITMSGMITIIKGITFPSFAGGGYLIYPWVGRCSAAPHTLTLFKTNIADFPTLFKTEFRFFIPCLRYLSCLRQKLINRYPD